jgi:AraC-like DNA-binding protein
MNKFFFQHGCSKELKIFPHIKEIGTRKNSSIQLNSLPESTSENIRVYYINEGKFEWKIQQHQHLLYPGDIALILPGQNFGSEKGFLEIGSLSWMHIQVEKLENGKLIPGKWSGLSKNESQTIGKVLLLRKSLVFSGLQDVGQIIQRMCNEMNNQEIGFATRVNQLIDELFIAITRQLTRQNNTGRDFPKIFMQLEQTLRENLSHQWTVEEMAALVGLGTTMFTEKVKSYTGFSPLNYLITIRISEAIRMLKGNDQNVTDIALDTGFYSSQHFSTTFKKLTGYRPSEFRKNHLKNK